MVCTLPQITACTLEITAIESLPSLFLISTSPGKHKNTNVVTSFLPMRLSAAGRIMANKCARPIILMEPRVYAFGWKTQNTFRHCVCSPPPPPHCFCYLWANNYGNCSLKQQSGLCCSTRLWNPAPQIAIYFSRLSLVGAGTAIIKTPKWEHLIAWKQISCVE